MIPTSDQIEAVERELERRKKVYPGLLKTGEMKFNNSLYEIECMKSVLKTLIAAQDQERKDG